MNADDILRDLQEHPEKTMYDWTSIRNDIHNAKKNATTEAEHVRLLGMHKYLMDFVQQNCISPSDLDAFLRARREDYMSLIVLYEALDGSLVSPERLNIVVQREVAAGRMASNDELTGIISTFVLPKLAAEEHPPPEASGFWWRFKSFFRKS